MVTAKKQTNQKKKFVYFISNYIDYDTCPDHDISNDNHEYNLLHCYVDQFDKEVKMLWNHHRIYKWPQVHFHYLIHCFLENTRIFFNCINNVPKKKWMPKSDFLVQIVKEWTKKLTRSDLSPHRFLQYKFPKVYRKCSVESCRKKNQKAYCSECGEFFCYDCFFTKGHCFAKGSCKGGKIKKRKKSTYFQFLNQCKYA